MNIKTLIVLCLVIFVSGVAFGQEEVKEYYSKYDFKVAPEKSYYYKVGKKTLSYNKEMPGRYPDTVFVDSVKTYFTKSDKLRSRLFYVNGVMHGNYVTYYESGGVYQKGNYQTSRKVGLESSWHTNGAKKMDLNFMTNNKGRTIYTIVNYWDSLGTQLVNSGEGDCKCFISDDNLREEGKIVNGGRNGLWKTYSQDTLYYSEEYQSGELKSGTHYYKGKTYTYKQVEESAEFKGGVPSMLSYLRQNIRYPKEARKQNVTGKVYVKFIIEKDGSISNVQVLKGVASILDDEAVRVVSSMPKWNEGKQRGVPVRSQFILPISFSL